MEKIIVGLSGGLDSTTLLYKLVKDGYDVMAVLFYFGQKHKIELSFAEYHCNKLAIPYKIINLQSYFQQMNPTSAQIDPNKEVPTGDYTNDCQPATYTSMRNLTFLTVMAGIAEANGIHKMALGIQRVDEFAGYWDTSFKFAEAVQKVFDLNTEHPIEMIAPFIALSKVDEIKLGQELEIDYRYTISCYNGTNCGECPTCKESIAAFQKLGLFDPRIGLDPIKLLREVNF